MLKYNYLLFLLMFVFISCTDDDIGLNDIDTSEIKPEFKLPFVSGEIELIDIVDNIDSSLVVDDSTKILKVLFSDDSTFSLKSEKIITIDELEYTGSQNLETKMVEIKNIDRLDKKITLSDLAQKMPSLSFLKFVPDNSIFIFPSVQTDESGGDYSFSSFDNFKYAVVDSGFVNLKIKNNTSVPVDVDFIIRDDQNILLDIDVNDLAPNEIYSVKEDLKNKTIYSDLKINISKFTTPGSSGQPVAISPSTDNLEITFEMEDLIIREGEINTSEITELSESNVDIDLSFYDSVELKNIIFSEGLLEFKISSGLSYGVEVDYALPMTNKGDTIADLAVLNPNGTYSVVYNLENYDFDLYNEIKNLYNSIRVKSKLDIKSNSNYIIYKSGEKLDVSFTFSDLNFKEINGYFGSKTYNVDREEIELDQELFDFYDKIDGDFLLTNPSLGFNIYNSMGIPLSFNLDIEATDKDSNSESISISSQIQEAKDKDGSFTESKTMVNKDNSNIVNFINLPPSGGLIIDGSFSVNPNGVTYENFILNTSEIYGDISIELPFQISANKMVVTDTFNIDEMDLDVDLSSAKMLMDYESNIPISFDVNLIFLDSAFAEIDRNTGQMNIQGSDIDVNGYSVSTIKDIFSLDLSEKILEELNRVRNIIFKIELNTKNTSSVNITSDIKFKFESYLEIKLDGI
tara:strand:- start:74 stop:2134 length:2061 start_codon:yes stop_codon:yes gene_type:complete